MSHTCVLCDKVFDTKENLQEHFRVHGTDKGNAKHETRFKQQATPRSLQKAAPQPSDSLVPCDLCSQQFDTVAKVISHKYRKHPDSPVKHFCPWCGMQFPIKHLWSIHIAVHLQEGASTVGAFTCLEPGCGVVFHRDEALVYHCRSFHRNPHMLSAVPTAPPSKKVCVNSNGDVNSAYYCHLCGKQYIIKFNLRKHIASVHRDMTEGPPADLIRCTTCDAIFYNKTAYSFHNQFHSPDDLYVTSEEQRQQVVSKIDQDFDITRVKPLTMPSKKRNIYKLLGNHQQQVSDAMESMESFSPPPSDSDSDNEPLPPEPEAPVAVPAANPPSQAITLQEFVNMNQQIFNIEDKKPENTKPLYPLPPGLKPVGQMKKILVPKGTIKSGVKVLSKDEVQKLQKQGLIPVLPPESVKKKMLMTQNATSAGGRESNNFENGNQSKSSTENDAQGNGGTTEKELCNVGKEIGGPVKQIGDNSSVNSKVEKDAKGKVCAIDDRGIDCDEKKSFDCKKPIVTYGKRKAGENTVKEEECMKNGAGMSDNRVMEIKASTSKAKDDVDHRLQPTLQLKRIDEDCVGKMRWELEKDDRMYDRSIKGMKGKCGSVLKAKSSTGSPTK